MVVGTDCPGTRESGRFAGAYGKWHGQDSDCARSHAEGCAYHPLESTLRKAHNITTHGNASRDRYTVVGGAAAGVVLLIVAAGVKTGVKRRRKSLAAASSETAASCASSFDNAVELDTDQKSQRLTRQSRITKQSKEGYNDELMAVEEACEVQEVSGGSTLMSASI